MINTNLRLKKEILEANNGRVQIFLLSKPIEINFRKDTKGGLQNKKYLTIDKTNIVNSFELMAGYLKNKSWDEVNN